MARILVIDDERQIRSLLRRLLEAAGHEVAEADEGRAGLRQLREASAGLVIADIFMEGMEGIETIRAIRREFPELPVIAVSGGGRTGADFLPVARALGAARTLHKPFEVDELLAAVAELLPEHTGS